MVLNEQVQVKCSSLSISGSNRLDSAALQYAKTFSTLNLLVRSRNKFVIGFLFFSLWANQAGNAQSRQQQPEQASLKCSSSYLNLNGAVPDFANSKAFRYEIFKTNPYYLVSDGENTAHLRETPLAEPTVFEKANEGVDLSDLEQVTIQLTGPMCMVCLRRLEGRLITLPGVQLAKVRPPAAPTDEELKNPSQLKKRTALVNLAYDPRKVSISKIKEWIKANDFQIKSITKQK